MELQLPADLRAMVQRKVESGQYSSADEVLIEALRAMEDRDTKLAAAREEIRQKIEEGLRSIQEGRVVDGDEAKRILDERHRRYMAERQK